MKLTWFGGTTLRVHIGGKILVADPAGTSDVDVDELVSGADRVFASIDLPRIDALRWQRRRQAALDESLPDVLVHTVAKGATLIDAVSEPALFLLSAPIAEAGRWGSDAVAVAYSRVAAEAAADVLDARLIALAMPEAEADAAMATLRDRLNGTTLVALERGMALEI